MAPGLIRGEYQDQGNTTTLGKRRRIYPNALPATIPRRRHQLELIRGMQRWVVVSVLHVLPFTGCPQGVASIRTPSLGTISRRRRRIELLRGMQRPSVWVVVNHLSVLSLRLCVRFFKCFLSLFAAI
jgi:hypothetical protein